MQIHAYAFWAWIFHLPISIIFTTKGIWRTFVLYIYLLICIYHFLSNVSRAIQWAVFRNRIFAEHINAIEQIISINWPADKNDLHLSLSLSPYKNRKTHFLKWQISYNVSETHELWNLKLDIHVNVYWSHSVGNLKYESERSSQANGQTTDCMNNIGPP